MYTYYTVVTADTQYSVLDESTHDLMHIFQNDLTTAVTIVLLYYEIQLIKCIKQVCAVFDSDLIIFTLHLLV